MDLQIFHRKFFKILDMPAQWIVIITGGLLIVLMTYYVFSRYVLKTNFRGFEEIALLIALWLYFAGCAHASREQSHISATMINLFVKNKTVIDGLTVFQRIVGIGVVALLTYLCVDFMVFNISIGTKSSLLKIPMYCYHASLVVGFALMLIFDFCYLIDSIQTFVNDLREDRGKAGTK